MQNEPQHPPLPDQKSQDAFSQLKALVPHLNSDGSIPLNPMEYLFTYIDVRTKRITILLTRAGIAMPSSISYNESQLAQHIFELQRMLQIMRTLE